MPTIIQEVPNPSADEIKMGRESDIESGNWNLGNGEINCSLPETNTDGLVQRNGDGGSIYKTLEGLRQVQESAFVPRLITIGPVYHNKYKFEAMKCYKVMYMNQLLSENTVANGTPFSNEDRDPMNRLEEAMRDLSQRAREFYGPAKHPEIEVKDFIEMLKIDGCFIIQLLRKFHTFQQSRAEKAGDPILDRGWMLRTLQRDMIMLDNQLPYKVLKKIHRIMCPGDETSLDKLVVEFFKPLLPKGTIISEPRPREGCRGFDHMLHLFYTCFLSKVTDRVKKNKWSPPKKTEVAPKEAEFMMMVHRTRNLREAGVEIKRKEKSELLEIEFDDRALLIPPLFIGDDFATVLLNFVALEQCDHQPMPFFTNYFFFMDSMIHAREDVEVLHEARIVNHALGSNETLSQLVNKVCRQIVNDPEQCYLWEEIQKVNAKCNAYYEKDWLRWWRSLMSKYFSNPWSSISLLAAVFLLMLTIVQTFYIIYSYYDPDAYLLGRHRTQLEPSYGPE